MISVPTLGEKCTCSPLDSIKPLERPYVGLAQVYALAGRPVPPPGAADDYAGYPLVADSRPALLWFFGGLPLLIVLAWRWLRRAPQLPAEFLKDGDQP